MIAAELKRKGATVRIHDEYCQKETEEAMARISGIVSRAYRRRAENENASHGKAGH